MGTPQSFAFIGNRHIADALSNNLLRAGFQAVETVSEADCVFTYCSSQDDLEEIYLGQDGLISDAKPYTYLVDVSPAIPSYAKELAALATVSDLHAVEAPLVVGNTLQEQTFADWRNLAVLVAGEDPDIEACLPLLNAFASKVIRCGKAGSAQLAKCAHTLRKTLALLGRLEAGALCRAVSKASGAAWICDVLAKLEEESPEEIALAHAIENHTFSGEYTVDILLGELHAALNQADEVDLTLSLGESAEFLLRILALAGGIDFAPAAAALMYRDENECAAYGLDLARAEAALEIEEDEEDDPYTCEDTDDETCTYHYDADIGFGSFAGLDDTADFYDSDGWA